MESEDPRSVCLRRRTDRGRDTGPLLPALRLDKVGSVSRSCGGEGEAGEPLLGWNKVHVRHDGNRQRKRERSK